MGSPPACTPARRRSLCKRWPILIWKLWPPSNRLVGMDVIEAQEGALTASVKAYWSPAPQWCYGSILVRQPSRGSGAFLDEAIRSVVVVVVVRLGTAKLQVVG